MKTVSEEYGTAMKHGGGTVVLLTPSDLVPGRTHPPALSLGEGETDPSRRDGVPGFSLLELMLVVAIMGTLMAVVAYNILGSSERAKKRATEATLRNIEGGLTQYHLEYSAWPPDLATLVSVKPAILKDSKLADGWSTAVMYEPRALSDDKPYILGSAGPDKVAGNQDDMDIWTLSK